MSIGTEDIGRILDWIVKRGLAGDDEVALLHGFCERCLEAGLPLSRGIAIIDTLDPIYEGRTFLWRQDGNLERPVSEYEPGRDSQANRDWQKSPFFHLWNGGETEMRLRLERGETGGFEPVEELRTEGQTDWFAMVLRFREETVIGEMDCFIARWTTDRPGGFDDTDVAVLRKLTAALGLAIKSRSLARVAQSLVEAYLGRDAGRRVLEGRIRRGVTEKIHAALWFSDMQGFTAISDKLPSEQLIPLLNDYAEAVIPAIQGAGGDVLKLIGDGVLAMFIGEDSEAASRGALAAEREMRSRLAALQERRAAQGVPVAGIYLGLHIGDVFYGNIGSKDRLDFTVVGAAVNETHRISTMCTSVDRDFLVSSDFLDCLPEAERSDFVSVGRFALRGVGKAKELFTRDPEIAGS